MIKKDLGFTLSEEKPQTKMITCQSGDLFECPECGIQIYSDFGTEFFNSNNDNTIFVDR